MKILYLIFWKSIGRAVDLSGLKLLLLQPCTAQTAGGENFPSGKSRLINLPHLIQEKLICTTSGLTVLIFTTVPRTETSLPVIPAYGIA